MNTSIKDGLLEKLFKLKAHGTNPKKELVAGITTFLTMVYIIFVNPQILSNAGMDTQAVFVTTCLIAAVGSILMGLFANLPIALAPAMGLNAFFAFVVVVGMGYSWQIGMGTIFWGAVGLLLLTVFRVRYWLISNIPVSLRIGITSGIGLLIALLGLHNAGIVVASPATMVTVGDLASLPCALGALGFFLIVILAARGVYSAVLISMIVTTTLGVLFGDVKFQGLVSLPPSVMPVFGQLELVNSLDIGLAGIIFSFMLVNLFDSSGTLIGVTNKAGLADEKGRFPNMQKALYVDSISSVGGAFMGTSSVTAFIESSAGVSVGGRTGLTAIVVGILFLLAIFFSPL
ncbi:NCS2 family permease, partial [Plesiomonas sp.]|uniref:NCS2 family permease n=1 Tax=Plesiomonas sp. TaxID=2486279 RepID=UPI003F3476F6